MFNTKRKELKKSRRHMKTAVQCLHRMQTLAFFLYVKRDKDSIIKSTKDLKRDIYISTLQCQQRTKEYRLSSWKNPSHYRKVCTNKTSVATKQYHSAYLYFATLCQVEFYWTCSMSQQHWYVNLNVMGAQLNVSVRKNYTKWGKRTQCHDQFSSTFLVSL